MYFEQILAFLGIAAGSMVAEAFSQRAFGRVKGFIHFFIDFLLFIIILVYLSNQIGAYEFNPYNYAAVSFVMSFSSLLFVRGFTLFFGFTTKSPDLDDYISFATKKIMKVSIRDLIKSMRVMDIPKTHIRGVLIELGLDADDAHSRLVKETKKVKDADIKLRERVYGKKMRVVKK